VRFALRCCHGAYLRVVAADAAGTLRGDGAEPEDAACVFILQKGGVALHMKTTLRACSGRRLLAAAGGEVSATGGTGAAVGADCGAPDAERWRVCAVAGDDNARMEALPPGVAGAVVLRSAHGRYLTAVPGGGGVEVHARGESVGLHQLFWLCVPAEEAARVNAFRAGRAAEAAAREEGRRAGVAAAAAAAAALAGSRAAEEAARQQARRQAARAAAAEARAAAAAAEEAARVRAARAAAEAAAQEEARRVAAVLAAAAMQAAAAHEAAAAEARLSESAREAAAAFAARARVAADVAAATAADADAALVKCDADAAEAARREGVARAAAAAASAAAARAHVGPPPNNGAGSNDDNKTSNDDDDEAALRAALSSLYASLSCAELRAECARRGVAVAAAAAADEEDEEDKPEEKGRLCDALLAGLALAPCGICLAPRRALAGVRCASAAAHFLCGACLSRFVAAEAAAPPAAVAARGGRVRCPVPACAAPPFEERALAAHAAPAAFAAYLAAVLRAREAALAAEMEADFTLRLAAAANALALAHGGDGDENALVVGRRHVVEGILTLHCPRCGAAYVDFEGCFALSCARCAAAFCAWCCADCGGDAHAHVAACGGLWGDKAALRRAHAARATRELRAYLRTLRAHERAPLLAACAADLADLGVDANAAMPDDEE
jgi:hypothetical protein